MLFFNEDVAVKYQVVRVQRPDIAVERDIRMLTPASASSDGSHDTVR
jgi:hypothetical protein